MSFHYKPIFFLLFQVCVLQVLHTQWNSFMEYSRIQLSIVADKCKVMLQMLDVFQSRYPVAINVLDYLDDLQINLAANKQICEEVCWVGAEI